MLKKNKDLNLIIEGHTSADGHTEKHQPMSQARAEAVKKYLVTKGISERRLKAIGYGSSRPLVKGTSSSANARNRRVELKVTNHQVGFE
jgi:outer membrane protein OmpA-like peptidoglycan-associated protein